MEIFHRAKRFRIPTQKTGEILSIGYAVPAKFPLGVTFPACEAHTRTEGCLAMKRKRTLRQLVVLILALWYDLSQEEIGRRTGMTFDVVSKHLKRLRKKEIDDDVYELLLSAVAHRPAEVPLTRAFVEALDALHQESGLTEEEQASIEESVLDGSRLMRRYLTAVALQSRTFQPPADYPHEIDLPVCRQHAERQIARLRKLPPRSRFVVVRLGPEYQHWALVERCCEESERAASSSLKRAAYWARLAMVVARFVAGPAGWLVRIRAYALAHWANVLRVQGKLREAEARLEEAKVLWTSGSDPGGVLDPGRLLDLEGSLRRAQRRFEEALSLFDQAVPLTPFPERALMKKGTTFIVMGDFERSIVALSKALHYVESHGNRRFKSMLLLNLSSALCQVSRYGEAAELVEAVRRSPDELGKIDLARIPWLEGRILAGLGDPGEARRLLAEARRKFAAESMAYDVALAMLEEAGLLLAEGRTTEVKVLTLELAQVFDSKGVHQEAENALRVFEAAVQQEEATADLARRVLQFLFKARHDQGLRFES
jgi:tetratricopeptide (TPR) repeat protein